MGIDMTKIAACFATARQYLNTAKNCRKAARVRKADMQNVKVWPKSMLTDNDYFALAQAAEYSARIERRDGMMLLKASGSIWK